MTPAEREKKPCEKKFQMMSEQEKRKFKAAEKQFKLNHSK